jgi:hypothetical protein
MNLKDISNIHSVDVMISNSYFSFEIREPKLCDQALKELRKSFLVNSDTSNES